MNAFAPFCNSDEAAIYLKAGNNEPPILWQFLISEEPDVPMPIDPGTIFKLTISWPGGDPINHSSDAGDGILAIFDPANSILAWNYTIGESRLIPKGSVARYELERWLGGSQRTFIGGPVVVSGGLNAD